MNLKNFNRALDREQREQFLELTGTTQNYLWQITGGHRRPSLRLLCTLVAASKALFPDRRERWLSLGQLVRECDRAVIKREAKRVEA